MSLHGRVLIDKATFRIAPAERVALLGASGSGKSLTASAVLGRLPAGMRATGCVKMDGRELALGARGLGASDGLAAIHQDPTTALNPAVKVGHQLSFPLRKAGLSVPAARERAAWLLSAVGVTDPRRVLSGYAGELSGGELQRVCIALALASRCTILVADEPTTALDTISQARVADVLRTPAETPYGMLFITHDLALAASLCTRALVMHSGRIVEQAPMDQLLALPEHNYTRQLVAAALASTRGLPRPAAA